MGLGWNPWRALRERPHIEFALTHLPAADAIYGRAADGFAAILIDRRLTQVERADALAHELVHDERGGGAGAEGMPPSWRAIVARDETAVHREVARRRVPLEMLAELIDALIEMGLPIETWDIAQQFEVTEEVAATALRLLREHDAA